MKQLVKFVLVGLLVLTLGACVVTTTKLKFEPETDLELELVLETEATQIININNKVLFAFDSSDLDADANDVIAKVAALMAQYPDFLLKLEGHTDKFGPAEYNQILSEYRARSVKEGLIAKGVAKDRISSVKGFGETQLIPNGTHRENRRVLVLSTDNK